MARRSLILLNANSRAIGDIHLGTIVCCAWVSSSARRWAAPRYLGDLIAPELLRARAAQSNSTILIHAEAGAGKEVLARAIPFNSPRRDKPFMTINCGAIPRDQ